MVSGNLGAGSGALTERLRAAGLRVTAADIANYCELETEFVELDFKWSRPKLLTEVHCFKKESHTRSVAGPLAQPGLRNAFGPARSHETAASSPHQEPWYRWNFQTNEFCEPTLNERHPDPFRMARS